MRYIGIVLFGLTCLLAGWQLHGFYYPTQNNANKNSPATKLTPQRQSPQPQQTYDLAGYQAEPAVQTNKAAPSASGVHALLQAGNYRDAVALYSQQLNAASEQQSSQSRRRILEYAGDLIGSGSYSKAQQLLNHYLELTFRDVDALLLKANILSQRNEYNGQIDVLYDARSYAYRQQVITRITDDIRNTVDKYKQRLLENRRYPELLDLFQKLVYLEPDYSPYFIELAKAQRANNLEREAQRSLSLVLHDPDVGEQARRLLTATDDSTDSERHDIAQVDRFQGIPLQRRGSHFVVEATLNGYAPLKLIIDTGASLTVIKTEKLSAVAGNRLSKAPKHLFNTANGLVRAPVLNVGSLAIGQFEVANLEVGGLNLLHSEDVDGLLGMNFLKHYRFFIDQQNNLLRLSLNGH